MTQNNMQTQVSKRQTIKIPKWVIRNLKDYGNCALPNSFTDLPQTKVVAKLSELVGKTITLRETLFEVYDTRITRGQKYTKYLIAEVKR